MKMLIRKNRASVACRIRQSAAQAKFEARVYGYLAGRADRYQLEELDTVEEEVLALNGLTPEQKLQALNLRPVNECEQALVLGEAGPQLHQLYERILRP